MKKVELFQAAIKKLKVMNKKELKDFLDSVSPNINLEPTYENLRTQLDYKVSAYNNAYCGRKDKGGTIYKRCIITLFNTELAPREINIKLKWLCPSGVCDGNMRNEFGDETYVLTNKDIFEIKSNGSAREYLKKILNIRDELDFNYQKPYNLPFRIK